MEVVYCESKIEKADNTICQQQFSRFKNDIVASEMIVRPSNRIRTYRLQAFRADVCLLRFHASDRKFLVYFLLRSPSFYPTPSIG